MPERSVLFVDGNNWYHTLTNLGVSNLGRLNYAKVSRKLVGPRAWTATRYYVGQVRQQEDSTLYSAQRRYMAWLEGRDPRISVHYGRLEQRPAKNDAAVALKRYLAELKVRIDPTVYKELLSLADRHTTLSVTVEKAVDVMLAVDMVRMAERNEYDTAYLLSADGDFTPAVKAVGEKGKKVFAASVAPGAQLAQAVYKFLPLQRSWFDDCFGE
jgi:uncharacterized LabA/DUF88 family protein